MITFTVDRSHAEFSQDTIFRFLDLLQLTTLNNIKGHDKTSADYLLGRVFVCLLKEVDIIFKKKIYSTTGKSIKIKLTTAQGIAMYRGLLSMPVKSDQTYLYMILTHWIQLLDQQILKF